MKDTLIPMAVGFFFFAAIHTILNIYIENWIQVVISGVTAAIFLLAWLLLRVFPLPARYSHLTATVFGLVVLSNLTYSYHLQLGAVTTDEIYLALMMVGAGAIMLSRKHFILTLVLTVLGWSSVTALKMDWYEFIRQLIHTSVLCGFSTLVFVSRRKTYRRLEDELRERQSAAAALRNSERQYRSVIDSQGEGMAILDRERRVTFCNAAMADIFGSSRDMLNGRRLASLLSMEEWKCFSANTEGCDDGKRTRFEMDLSSDDGEVTHLLVTATPMYDDDGNLDGLLGLFRDITDRKQSELKQRKLAEQIQQAQKLESLGVLAGGIAHDFNNILMGVMGNADLVRQDVAVRGESQECVDEILIASRRAAELCRQMLGYSGKGKFVIERLDLSTVIRDMAHLLEIPTTKKAAIKYQLSEVLPAIAADATQISQVVMNLVTNASEAIDKEDGEIILTTNIIRLDQSYTPQPFLPMSLKSGAYVSLEVTDNGAGMDDKTKRRVFDPFFSTKFTGRGLGLAAVLGIVRGHNGTVEVFSEEGKGSSFRVLLPAVDQPADTRRDSVLKSDEWVGHGMVLIVDDEPTVLRVGIRLLKQMGFSVITATDGAEAVAIFKERHKEIDLVILDQTMPRLSGEQAFLRMRAIDGRASVLLSSGYSEAETARELVPLGLVGFLPKPYDKLMLRARLQAVFEGRQAFESVPPAVDSNGEDLITRRSP